MTKPEPKNIRIVNIVVSTSFEKAVPLEKMAATLSNTEYNPEQFPGLVYKLVEPNATFLLFSNGKLVCTGTKNRAQLEDSMKQLNKKIKEVQKRAKE